MLLWSGCSASTVTDQQPPFVVGLAEHTIRFASTFSTGPVGLGQSRAPEVDAFAVLLSQPNASRTFESLVREATPAGKVYALCGLQLTDPAAYAAALPELAAMPDQVDWLLGCTVQPEPVHFIVQAREPRSLPDVASGALPSKLQAFALQRP
jgi:hypothetical protein